MPAGMMASSASWAEETFGKAELGDPRRTARAVKIAGQLAANPGASIPKLAGSRAQAKAVYRFFNMLAATLKGLCTPHWMHTRAQAAAAPVVLMIQDTTTLNFGEAGRRAGTGPISSNGADHGLHLHSVLAVVPATDGGEPQVLGLAHHAVYARTPAPPEETQQQRRGRRRESARWIESMEAIASPLAEAATRWIQVADREADIFEVFARARELRMGCIIRAAGSAAMRGASLGHGHADSKVAFETLVRRLPAEGSLQPLHVRGATSRPARTAMLQVSFAPLTLHAPKLARGLPSEQLYVVRVFEPSPPANIRPPHVLEWVLVTTEPVLRVDDAWRIVRMYEHRWLIEEFHKCLKTGCAVEQRQLETADRLEPLIGMLAIVACQLLQLKLKARAKDTPPAMQTHWREHVQLLALYRRKDPSTWSCRDFWREVAMLGGFMGRRGDGDPGWITLWRGWMQLEAMVVGARLVTTRQPEPTCG